MTIEITTVLPDPVPLPPETYTISGLSRVEVRAIRTLLGGVAPAKGSLEMTPTYSLFCKLADAGFESLPTEPRERNENVTRFKFNGKGV